MRFPKAILISSTTAKLGYVYPFARFKPMPADAEVFNSPGATALKRIRENWLKDLAKKASDESRAALIGAMKP